MSQGSRTIVEELRDAGRLSSTVTARTAAGTGPSMGSAIGAATGSLPDAVPTSGVSPSTTGHDLYANVLSSASRSPANVSATLTAPRCPMTLPEAGLTLGFVADLVLKLLYAHGSLLGQEISNQLRLPFPIVDEALRFLKDQRCLEISGGDVVGRISYRFTLTELGRLRARESFDQCRYVGPAPVTIDQYVAQCRRQTITGFHCTPQALRQAFQDFVIRDSLLEDLGPAVCSGRSIFIYGPPGNGKTVIAKGLGRFLNQDGGDIYVPYAIQAENTIITLFDPVLHQSTDDAELVRKGIIPRASVTSTTNGNQGTEATSDLRWRRIRRPVIVTGGELTLDMLELQMHRTGNFYNAPLHIKANGGVFLIDDFGRQLVSPKDLLNRWIVPLEEKVDYLTLTTGRKFGVPFEQLTLFSTNLDPRDLVDDAFLRRIRYKVRIDPPCRETYTRIVEAACRQRGFEGAQSLIDHVFENYYEQGRAPRASDPRDLLDLAEAFCRYHDRPRVWDDHIVRYVAGRLFHDL